MTLAAQAMGSRLSESGSHASRAAGELPSSASSGAAFGAIVNDSDIVTNHAKPTSVFLSLIHYTTTSHWRIELEL